MAKLDDLIGQISDEDLRAELNAALRDLRRGKKFGLVFEEHIPEVTLLHNFPLRVGSVVYRRKDASATEPLRIEKLSGKRATVRPIVGGNVRSVPPKDLLTLRRFGDPVYPTLTPIEMVERDNGKPYHAVINGENYHALQLLTFLHEGQVDCMFLDPPYNTGATDWKYNNNYVDRNDAWRHSKWLSMMDKRLKLAKRLLKPDGVIVITIDEHELHHLGVLVEQLFPGYLRYVVSIVINSRGSTGTRNFGVVEEQALFLVPDIGRDLVQPREGFVSNLVGRAEDKRAEEILRKALEAIPDLETRLMRDGVPSPTPTARFSGSFRKRSQKKSLTMTQCQGSTGAVRLGRGREPATAPSAQTSFIHCSSTRRRRRSFGSARQFWTLMGTGSSKRRLGILWMVSSRSGRRTKKVVSESGAMSPGGCVMRSRRAT